MKFKKGKLYKILGDYDSTCAGCILKYKGLDRHNNHYGESIKAAYKDCECTHTCTTFQSTIDFPDVFVLVEHIDMITFCKKLRKELRK